MEGEDAWQVDENGEPIRDVPEQRDAVIIPRNDSGTAEIMMPAAGDNPSYAAFKIGGDCSKPSYMGEWKEGQWTDDGNGELVKGEDDGAKITIVFTFTSQQFYQIRFVVEPFFFDDQLFQPEQISVTAGGKVIPFNQQKDGDNVIKMESDFIPVSAGQAFTCVMKSSDAFPTESPSHYSTFHLIVAETVTEDGVSSEQELFYAGDYDENWSISEEFTFEAGTVPVNAEITVTITVFKASY